MFRFCALCLIGAVAVGCSASGTCNEPTAPPGVPPASPTHHALVEGRVIDVADIEKLATMPSKEELISKIMMLINSGAQRLASTTNGVARNLAVVIREAKAKES